MITLSSVDIEKYKLNQTVILNLAKQVQKDFRLYDEEISFSGDTRTAYQELFDQILPLIDRMLNLDSARFFSLLYAIDVDEKKVKPLIFGEEEINPSFELTHLILERELLKVISRQLYAEQSNI